MSHWTLNMLLYLFEILFSFVQNGASNGVIYESMGLSMGLSMNLKLTSSLLGNLFSSVQSLSHVWLFVTPWTAARQPSQFITNSQSPPKPMSIELVMPSNHFILSYPLLLLPPIFPRIRVLPNKSVLHIRGPNYWSFSFSIVPSNEHSGICVHHFTANRWGNSGNSGWLYFWGAPKSLQIMIEAMKLKHAYSLEGKLWPT